MCTYNGEKFLKEQINSILNQTQKVNEIIVCDDGSSDSTISILEVYSIENPNLFNIIINDVNLRSVKNFEKAIGLCTGEIIFLSDQDDIWVENKVEKMIAFFDDKNINGVFTNAFLMKNKIIQKKSLWNSILFDPNIIKNNLELSNYLIYKSNFVTGATMAFRKKNISEIMPFPQIDNFHHDHWIALNLSLKNSLALINLKLISYRIHKSQQVGTQKNPTKFKLLKNKIINNVLFVDCKPPIFTNKKTIRLLKNNILLFEKIKKQNAVKNINIEVSDSILKLKEKLDYVKNNVSLKNDFRLIFKIIMKKLP